MTNTQKEDQGRRKVIVIYRRAHLKSLLKTLAPGNPSDGLIESTDALMPQKWSRKADACCADNVSFLTV